MSAATPDPDARGCRFAVVAARWNEGHVRRLVDAALEVLARHGAAAGDLEVTWVPGALELPLACLWAAKSGRWDAVLAFGVVVRGETEHFRLVDRDTAAERSLTLSPALAAVRARLEEELASVTLIRLDETIQELAGRIGLRDLRSLDAIHLATALSIGDVPEAFVTYDDRLAAAARPLGLNVLQPGRP